MTIKATAPVVGMEGTKINAQGSQLEYQRAWQVNRDGIVTVLIAG